MDDAKKNGKEILKLPLEAIANVVDLVLDLVQSILQLVGSIVNI